MTTTVLAYIPSPSQGVWHLGPIPLRAYALFIVAGMLAALLIGDKRWQERGGEPGVIYSIFWWAMPFGLIGGRLYHVITDWQTYFGDDGAGFLAAFRIWEGGLGIWGAVALGSVGAWIGCRQHGIPLPAFGDAVAPGIVLAQAIGRLGNYFNQELYGRPTTLPWGLEIYERRDAAGYLDSLNGVSTGQLVEVVHPTFLYELLWNVLVFAALIYIDRRFKIGHGRLFAMYVAGYCVGRFWIELMRSDHASMPVEGIRVNSFTSTFVFIGAVVYIMVAPKGREDPATLKGNAPEVEKDGGEDTAVEDFVKELTGVAAATTGVVAAAKVAGEFEDEDAKAAADEADEEPEAEADAEEAEPEVEEAAEAEAEEAEPEAEAEAEEAAESEAAEEEVAVGGVGAVEGEEVVEAEEAAPEVHEAAVEAADEAEEVAAESEAAAEDTEAEAEEVAEPTEGVVEPEPEAEEAAETESVGGVGAVESEEVAEAVEAAPEAHEAAVDAVEEPEEAAGETETADEVAEPEPDAEPPETEAEPTDVAEDTDAEESETEDAEAAVGEVETVPSEEEAAEEAELVAEEADAAEEQEPEAEAGADEVAEPTETVVEAETEDGETEDAEAAVGEVETVPSEEEAAEEAESVAEEADAAEEQEPEAEILAEEAEPEPGEDPEPAEDVAASEELQESAGRIRRWLRGRRG